MEVWHTIRAGSSRDDARTPYYSALLFSPLPGFRDNAMPALFLIEHFQAVAGLIRFGLYGALSALYLAMPFRLHDNTLLHFAIAALCS